MQLMRFSDVAAYYEHAKGFLLAHEAEHCLPLGICSTLIAGSNFSAAPPYLAVVEQGERIAAAAVMTPPHNLILSLIADADLPQVLDLLARDLYATYDRLPGVHGATAISRAFAERWQNIAEQRHQIGIRERIYQLEKVAHVQGVSGRMRRAEEGDRALLERWIVEFSREALGERERINPDEWFSNMLGSPVRGLYVWEDGAPAAPVTMVGYGGPTPHGIRVGPVFTPPDLRRRGYASACTAAVSQMLLDAGRSFVFLFTDLANPTSNSIYQQIGYRPVVDVDVYEFADA